MNKINTATAIFAAITSATAAQAQGISEDWYVSVFAGYASIDTIAGDNANRNRIANIYFDDALNFGVAVGKELIPGLRGEIEVSYANYETQEDGNYSGTADAEFTVEGDATVTYLLANLWYDIPVSGLGGVTPYVGGGLGRMNVDIDTTFQNINFGFYEDTSVSAWQAGLGARVPVGRGIVDVSYRYKAADKFDMADRDGSGFFGDAEVEQSNLQVGYTLSF